MQTARRPGLLPIISVALGLAMVVLTSVDPFQQLAGGIYGIQAIASALVVVLLVGSLMALLVRRAQR